MLHLFTGDDTKAKLASYGKFIKAVPKTTETLFINRNNFDRAQIENLYSGSGLFFLKSTIVFHNIFEREEARDFLLEKLDLMAESGNDFIFLEGKLNKPVVDAFRKQKAEINIFELPKAKKEKFDNFLVANAFSTKDKLNLWIYFRQAMDLGVGMEELIGVLFWKIKDMLIRRNFGKFTQVELQNSAAKLSYLLPEARTRGEDAESAFEQFLLEVF